MTKIFSNLIFFREEVKLKTKRWIISLICYAFAACGQSLATFITVCTLVVTKKNDLRYLNFFAMIYLFGIINYSFAYVIPRAIQLFIDVRSACQRIEIFFKETEYLQEESAHKWDKAENINFSHKLDDISNEKDSLHCPFVNLHDVTSQLPSKVCISSPPPRQNAQNLPLLKNINLELSSPELVLICGTVGSGKSSLLETILGEFVVTNGFVDCFGKLAYVSDSPWIFPGTIRENIVFGLPYNESKYNKIIKACQLEKDLDNFPEHDLIRIGENSATLSGGQCTRIALARAVYSEADIYLLDDPLSSLDVNVAENVFRLVIHLHNLMNGYSSLALRSFCL